MALDGIFIAVLSNAPSVALAATVAALATRAALRAWQFGTRHRVLRTVTGLSGAVAVFVIVIVGWNWFTGPSDMSDVDATFSGIMAGPEGAQGGEGVPGLPDGMEEMIGGITVGADVVDLKNAESGEEARIVARRLADRLEELGLSNAEIAEVVRDVSADMDPSPAAAATAIAAEIEAAEPSSPDATRDTMIMTRIMTRDSLAVAYARAVSMADSGRTDPLGRRLGLMLAADTIDELVDETEDLNEDVRDLEAENEQLENDLAAGREGGITALFKSLIEDLGVGLGWAALYFTACLALGNGRTPGKTITRIRVVRLDGGKMTWWFAFERFGGYAAGLATGLLGYIQVYWDPNRQAVHDKIAGTAVVRIKPGVTETVAERNDETASVESATPGATKAAAKRNSETASRENIT